MDKLPSKKWGGNYLNIEEEILNHLFENIVVEDKNKDRKKFEVKKARNLLDDCIYQKVNIEDLAKELNISQRQFHDTFKTNYGLTPKHYLKYIKLNAIRRELLVASADINISDIAFKYGFTHMSHFAQEYKKMFSKLPSESLKK